MAKYFSVFVGLVGFLLLPACAKDEAIAALTPADTEEFSFTDSTKCFGPGVKVEVFESKAWRHPVLRQETVNDPREHVKVFRMDGDFKSEFKIYSAKTGKLLPSVGVLDPNDRSEFSVLNVGRCFLTVAQLKYNGADGSYVSRTVVPILFLETDEAILFDNLSGEVWGSGSPFFDGTFYAGNFYVVGGGKIHRLERNGKSSVIGLDSSFRIWSIQAKQGKLYGAGSDGSSSHLLQLNPSTGKVRTLDKLAHDRTYFQAPTATRTPLDARNFQTGLVYLAGLDDEKIAFRSIDSNNHIIPLSGGKSMSHGGVVQSTILPIEGNKSLFINFVARSGLLAQDLDVSLLDETGAIESTWWAERAPEQIQYIHTSGQVQFLTSGQITHRFNTDTRSHAMAFIFSELYNGFGWPCPSWRDLVGFDLNSEAEAEIMAAFFRGEIPNQKFICSLKRKISRSPLRNR